MTVTRFELTSQRQKVSRFPTELLGRPSIPSKMSEPLHNRLYLSQTVPSPDYTFCLSQNRQNPRYPSDPQPPLDHSSALKHTTNTLPHLLGLSNLLAISLGFRPRLRPFCFPLHQRLASTSDPLLLQPPKPLLIFLAPPVTPPPPPTTGVTTITRQVILLVKDSNIKKTYKQKQESICHTSIDRHVPAYTPQSLKNSHRVKSSSVHACCHKSLGLFLFFSRPSIMHLVISSK